MGEEEARRLLKIQNKMYILGAKRQTRSRRFQGVHSRGVGLLWMPRGNERSEDALPGSTPTDRSDTDGAPQVQSKTRTGTAGASSIPQH